MRSDINSVLRIDHRINGKSKSLSFLDDKTTSYKAHAQLSVIIPTYMEEKILLENIKVFTGELKKKYNLELIISDGGSSDNTVEISKEYADKIVIHNLKERQTIAGGRNKGTEVARGDVLIFLNADSTPENPDSFFEEIYNWALETGKYKNYDALATYVTSFPEETIFKDKLFYTLHNSYVRFLNLIGLGMGRGECQIVRADVFRKVSGYNEKIAAGEDFDLYRRISHVGRIGFAKNLRVLESPRRFRKYGYLKVVSSWTVNSLSVWIFGKSVSKEWEAVR